jgi:hypothetical protein
MEAYRRPPGSIASVLVSASRQDEGEGGAIRFHVRARRRAGLRPLSGTG